MKTTEQQEQQLRRYLQASIPARNEEARQRFTQHIMHRLPRRKRTPLRSRLINLILSPLWMFTAFIICLVFACNHPELILNCLPFHGSSLSEGISNAARHMPPLLLLVMIVAIITYEMYCDFIATWERKEPQHKLKLHNNH